MKFKTTRGFFGAFAIRPKRPSKYAPSGAPLEYLPSLTLNLVRMGVDPATKVAWGMLDLDALPQHKIAKAKVIWGKDWASLMEEEVIAMGKANGLVVMESGEVTPEPESTGAKVVVGPRTVKSMKAVTSK